MQGDWRGLECQAHQTDPNSLLHLRTSLSVLEVRTRVRSDEITSGELTECLLEATLENWRDRCPVNTVYLRGKVCPLCTGTWAREQIPLILFRRILKVRE